MKKDFWKKLHKPILALAPMADVTDAAFRRIIAKYGKPDVIFTEFVSCDGLCSAGKKNLLPILKYSEKERPIVAQVFGAKPENFYKSAKIIKKLGFDGIDINMGCPDKKVLKQGAGVALINNPKLAQEIIRQTKKGAGKLPVSIKTRIGYDKYDKKEFKKWLIALLEQKPSTITIHGRTKKEMSLVPAHWDIIAEAVKIRNQFDNSKNKTLILGNGDIQSVTDAKKKAKETGADGIMIGRAIFGNPWLFSQTNSQPTPLSKKLFVLLEHTKLFTKIFKGKNFDIMKKHFKSYATGFPGAKELRIKLMACQNADEVEKIINSYL
ncbi:MAG: tRNA-dihydrouridine synthase [Patescibacteria group bacterium]